MIIPASPEAIAKMSDPELVAAYEGIGFDHDTALAYTGVLRPKTSLPTEHVMSVSKALALAEEIGHEPLAVEMQKSSAAGLSFVTLTDNEDGVAISSPQAVKVSWFADDESEITLASVEGSSVDFSPRQVRELNAAVEEVAARTPHLYGVAKGVEWNRHNGEVAQPVFVPGLDSLRADLHDTLTKAGFTVLPDGDDAKLVVDHAMVAPELEPTELVLKELTSVVGGFAIVKSLRDSSAVSKSVDEKRFTLAPMYIPDRNDAHGDWAESDELQKALWEFSRGSKLIAKQHQPEKGAVGEAVEFMVVPWEHTVPMHKADGSSEDVTFPAGTPWLGVIWDEETWPLVKSGAVRGYSIGGRANLLNVDLPDSPA